MENRNRIVNTNLTSDELYALERRARAERSKEIWRLLGALGRKMIPHVSLGGKVVPNA